jgi:hypothetical protein
MKYSIKVYVACSFTLAPQEYRDKIKAFKDRLGTICEVLDFSPSIGKPSHIAWKHVMDGCLYASDLVLAFCDLPAIGLGIELGTQMEARRKPVLAVAHTSAKVTDLLLDPGVPGYEFQRYQDFDELFIIAENRIIELESKKGLPLESLDLELLSKPEKVAEKSRRYPIKVYVGCGLTHAPEEFRNQVERLKAKLDEVCEVLYFTGLVDIPPRQAYVHDINKCVYDCGLLLAICDHPSTGLGMELGTRIKAAKKPVLAVAQTDAKVSDLLFDPREPGYEFRRYDDFDEIYDMAIERIKEIMKEKE